LVTERAQSGKTGSDPEEGVPPEEGCSGRAADAGAAARIESKMAAT